MNFKYGSKENNVDITVIVYKRCIRNKMLYISNNIDERIRLFGKSQTEENNIYINHNNTIYEFDNTKQVFVDINNNILIDESEQEKINYCLSLFDKNQRLKQIHLSLSIDYGTFNEEFPEQLMVSKYLSGDEKVLEIGGNIGRNSMVIAHILNKNNNNNFVSLESDFDIAQQLKHNRDKNNLNFHIEQSALSKKKLIQKGWDTIPSDIILDGYKAVNIIDYNTLLEKYNINFDTLIADCEAALYHILYDMPEMLNDINLIIMENDYHDINQKKFVDEILTAYNFVVDYQEAGGWGPCYDYFFEVWIKKNNLINIDQIYNIKINEGLRLINVLNHNLESKNNLINNLSNDLKIKNIMNANLTNDLNDKNNHINHLNNIINDKNNHISNLDNNIINLNNIINDKNNYISNLNNIINDKNNHISNLNNIINDKNNILHNKDNNILNLNNKIKQLNKNLCMSTKRIGK